MDSTSQQIVILNLEVNEGDKKNYFRFLLHGKDVEYVTIDPAVYDANVTVFPRGLLPQLPPFPAGDWNAGRIELVPESCKATFLSTEREEPIRYAPGDAVEKWLLEVLIAGSVISGFGAGLNEMIALSGTAELVPAKLPRKRVHGVAKCQEERGVDGDDSLPRDDSGDPLGDPLAPLACGEKKFAGGDDPGVKKAFKAWLFEINHILEADAAYFAQTPFMAVNWVGTRTEGEAFSYIEDFLPASGNNVNPFPTAQAVVQYLKNIYGEFDDEAKVIEDYRKLNMKASEVFDSFLAKFNSKVCRLDHSDKQMQYDLHHKLNDKYRRRVGNMLLNNYNDLVIACRKLKNTFSIEEEHDKNHTNRPMKAQTGGSSSRYKPYRSRYTAPEVKSNGISLSTMPEKYLRLPKLTSSLRSQLSRENKCWNCHEPGHRANQDSCPLYEYADLLKSQRLKDKATHLRMATIDDSDYEHQLSESELPSEPESEGEDLIDLDEDDQSKD